MKVIIAGSRDITDATLVWNAIVESGIWHRGTAHFEIVSGTAKGVDRLGEEFAKKHNVKLHLFPADWDNLEAPGAVIRIRRDGKKYNARAGADRNIKMGDFADELIAIWDGKSRGTEQMINYMKSIAKSVYLHDLSTGKKGWVK